MSRLIFLAICFFIVVRMYMLEGLEAALASSLGVALLASMIWFTDFWTSTIMTFGFWESKAKDFKSPQHSMPALVLMAWILLLLFAFLVASK